MRPALTVFRVAAVAAVAGVVIAASLGAAAPPGKSGEHRIRSLTLAVPDPIDSPGEGLASAYARAVSARSGGSLRIRIAEGPAGATDPDDSADASALSAVHAGRAQVAIVPALSLRTVGVDSFAPVDVPFLIDTDSLAARLTADPAVVGALESGLSRASLVGLGVLPEGLYRTFGYLAPLLTAADFAGVEIRAPRSEAIREALRTLGARPVAFGAARVNDVVLAGFGEDVPSGSGGSFPANAYTAGDVAVLAKLDVVVASAAAFRALPPGLRSALRTASRAVRLQAVEAAQRAGDRRSFCRAGGTVVAASPGAAEALRSAAAGSHRARAPGSSNRAALVARIARLARAVDGGGGCAPGSPPVSTPAFEAMTEAGRNRLLVPDGTYRHDFAAGALERAGAAAETVRDRSGVATLVVSGEITRHFRFFALEWQGRPGATCRGRIGLVAGENVVRWNPLTPCGDRLAVRWRGQGRRDLLVTVDSHRSERGWTGAFAGLWKAAYPTA